VIEIASILKEKGLLSEKDIDELEKAIDSGASIEEELVARGISEQEILLAKGKYWDTPTRMIEEGVVIPFETLAHIPEESAKHYHVVPLGIVDGVLEVGMVNPDNIDALDALNFISSKEGIPFKVFIISERSYKEILRQYSGVASGVGQALSEFSEMENSESSSKMQQVEEEREVDLSTDTLESTVREAGRKGATEFSSHDEAPITKVVATVLRNAIEVRASDIHVEPSREQVRVRFRVDGELRQSLVLPSKVQQAVIARIKILAGIKLDEKRKPQDGRFSATIGGRRVDFRVSTFPTYFGEKAVLRILDSEHNAITLKDLGMNEDQLATVHRALQAPYGIILITGPTGSGKSTSLYAMLNEIDRETMNVLSLEDPVEYTIPSVSQSQVRPEIGYTFASGIRSVLRQDPDVIMVGEIRDKETAQLAVQAALTGHLVFSTLHTNNAAGAVPRLIDMGVDPYLLAPTLVLIVAQRLARRICPDSGKVIPIEGALQKMIEGQFIDLPKKFHEKLPEMKEFLAISPTKTCPNGTRGRLGVFEMLEANDELKHAVLTGVEEEQIYHIARKDGMMTLKEDAIIKAAQKLIPYEDVAQIGGALNIEPIPELPQESSQDDEKQTESLATLSKKFENREDGGRDIV
jgi:type IV pilus assembly protein PilB